MRSWKHRVRLYALTLAAASLFAFNGCGLSDQQFRRLIEGFLYVVWYNQAVADRLGITIREEGMTYEDLLGYVKRVQAYNQDAEAPIAAFLDLYYSGANMHLFYSLLLSLLPGGDPVTAGDDEVRTAAEQVLSLMEELGRCNPMGGYEPFSTWGEAAQVMMDDRALFFSDATWYYNKFEQFDADGMSKLRLAQMPAVGTEQNLIGGYMTTWAVFKDAPGRDAGIQLLQYWSQPAIADRWVRYTKCPTGLRGNLYDPSYGNDVIADYLRRMCAKYENRMVNPMTVKARVVEVMSGGALAQRIRALMSGNTGPVEDRKAAPADGE